ncbi:damage-inducible protein DinB [Exilibacterium tricleocarpae]|uniref:Damage-inducible protein DinB n=1 Tax=Exilibacterium tricleocarpae TaxID=2591008 RepID=A0A545SQM5_9GAMM|nr:DinB family protein [Exilibacterium tricleocarpae]TQV67271.1 damage-inducible protein DinB [Exilibacterium tricleocarpae]
MKQNFLNYFDSLSKYNIWMNQKIYAVCDSLSDGVRKKDMGAFFGSIHRTLDHILYGDKAWLERLRDGTFTPRDINKTLHEEWEALKTERFVVDKEIDAWVQTLTDKSLDSIFTFTSNVDKKERSVPRRILIQHLFNHQTHHRGQLTTLLSQLGLEYGSTDLPFLPELND